MYCFQIGLQLLGIIVVVSIVNPWLLLSTAAAGVIFYFLRIFYLATSRSVKRLEGVSEYYYVHVIVSRKKSKVLFLINLPKKHAQYIVNLNIDTNR